MDRYEIDDKRPRIKEPPLCIFTDQAGFRPRGSKRAVIPFECDFFEITDKNGTTVFSGETVPFGADEASGDTVCTADFSGFTKKGEYRVKAGGKFSALFRIDDDVYENVLDSTLKAFYFLRCGCGLDQQYAGVWKHGKCHTSKAVLWEDGSEELDVSGGWHDAGDYGRYVTAGSVAAAHLLYAYRLFPEAFGERRVNIPSDNGMPDILAEVKYELEWLLKMQRADGAVYHKLTTLLHAPFVMPEKDTETLYVFPVSSMAAADFTAVCALAAPIYEKYDSDFSGKLRSAAELSAVWLEAHPEFIDFTNPEGCNTGGYGQWDDSSNRFWACCEMFALTGDRKYSDKAIMLMDKHFPLTEFGYTETGGLGALSYMLCTRNKDEGVCSKMKYEFIRTARNLQKLSDNSGYGAAMSLRDFWWGSNMNVLKRGMIFAVTDVLCDGDFREYAERQMHYILGTDPLGISYITGIGEYSANNPHLRPAYADGVDDSIPGFVVGGPNSGLSDQFAKELIAPGTPPMKCYADATESYSLNEVTIYWNSPAVFLLGYLCGNSFPASN